MWFYVIGLVMLLVTNQTGDICIYSLLEGFEGNLVGDTIRVFILV